MSDRKAVVRAKLLALTNNKDKTKKKTAAETNDELFCRWAADVQQLLKFVNTYRAPVGELVKLLGDCEDHLNYCPLKYFEFFIQQIVSFAWFAREEAWKLENGELIHPFQVENHKAFIVQGIDTLATGELSRTTRHKSGSKISLVCHDGFLFCLSENLMVSASFFAINCSSLMLLFIVISI
jgi:hypothetical protein